MIKRLLIISLLVTLINDNASGQESRISINLEGKSYKEVFDILEKESNYHFFYSDNFIPVNVSSDLDIKDATIEQILDKLFESTDFGYKIMENNMIVITLKKNLEQFMIVGSVTNQYGKPVIGATVQVKGSSIGTYTDDSGIFKFDNISNNSVLILSFIGMTTQEVPLNGKIRINVVLEEEAVGLNEVVVIGYGSQRKKDVTGSIVSVTGEKLMETATFSPAQALQGKASGVVVQQTNAKPGEDPRVMIRGNRSLSATNEPLYVVDGIPLVSGYSEIPQSNIASIDILKDASATAIYGSRGANGVILITTKKGMSGKPVIEYNAYYGTQKPRKLVELFDAAEWVDLIREAYRTTGAYPALPTWEKDQIMMPVAQETDPYGIAYKIQNAYDPDGSWHPERLETVDWMGEVMRTGQVMNHELSVRGGTESFRSFVSASYFYQGGLVKGQDYERYSARVNFDWNLTRKVILGGFTSFSFVNRNDGANLFSMTQSISPLANKRNAEGELIGRPGNDTQLWNPILNITEYINQYRRERFLGSYYLEITLPLNFKFRSNFGLDFGPSFDQAFYGSMSSDRQGGFPRASNSGDDNLMFTWENLLYWNKTIKDHVFGLTLLQSIQQERSESYEINVQNLAFSTQLWYNVGSAQTISGVSSRFTKWQMASFMGRLNYTLKDRYLLTVSARYDGSSRLAPGHKWVLFPSAALAWRITEENFMQNISVLNNLKLRVGYGMTGNSAIEPYKTAGNLSYSRYNYGASNVMSFYQNEMPNPALSWEKTKQWNAGIDFGFLKSRINGTIDFYIQNTFDLLMSRQLPNVSGFSSVVYNIGKTRNKGIEVTLNTVNIKNSDFEWVSDLTFSRNKEEIVELYGGKNDDTGNGWFIGQPLSVYYDYRSLGIWQLDEEEEALKYGASSKPGTIKVYDKVPDYKITADDREIIGTPRPKFVAGFSNRLKYKNIDMNFFLNSSYGNMLSYSRDFRYTGRYNSIKTNYWRVTEYDGTGKPIVSNGSNEAPRPNNGVEAIPYVSSLSYFDASFIRLSNAAIGYTIHISNIRHKPENSLRLYISVQNAFCITKYPGTDPESGSSFNVPNPRTFLIGVNLNLQ